MVYVTHKHCKIAYDIFFFLNSKDSCYIAVEKEIKSVTVLVFADPSSVI